MVNTPTDRVLTKSNVVKSRRDTFKSKIRNDFAKQVSTWHSYFINRVTPTWNALPEKIAQAPTLNMFKIGLGDRFKTTAAIARHIKCQAQTSKDGAEKNTNQLTIIIVRIIFVSTKAKKISLSSDLGELETLFSFSIAINQDIRL